jgi:hypothetical protein
LRIIRDRDTRGEVAGQAQLITKVRVLAFHMLAFGREHPNRGHSGVQENATYLLDLALRTVRYCAQVDDVETGKAVLQQASEYIHRLKNPKSDGGRQERIKRYELDYLTMHIALVSDTTLIPK